MRRLAVLAFLVGCFALLTLMPARAATAFSGGSGTAEDPYRLSSAADLRRMRELFARDDTFAAYNPCFLLTADVRLNQGLGETFMWRPVPRFAGDFDGGGHTITGMYVPVDNAVTLPDGTLAAGFIGELAQGSRVHSLALSGCVEAPKGKGLLLAGGLVCDNRGEIADCVSFVTITVTKPIQTLQSSGIAAASTGTLLRCVDQSRFYIYPEAADDSGTLHYAGLTGDPAGPDKGETVDCSDLSQNVGTAYPTVWNLYEPSPMPVTEPAETPPAPTDSPAPVHTSPVPASTPPAPAVTLAIPADTVSASAVPPVSVPTAVAAPNASAEPHAWTPTTQEASPSPYEVLQEAVTAISSLFDQPMLAEGDYRYTVNSDGRSVAIEGYQGSASCLTVPDTLAGLPVTRIGRGAFSRCTFLLELTLPDGVTALADDALVDCHALYRLHLPAALQHLPLSALRGCIRLIDIEMPIQVLTFAGDFPNQTTAVTAWTYGNPAATAYCAAHGLTVQDSATGRPSVEATDSLSIRFRPDDPQAIRSLMGTQIGRMATDAENVDARIDGLAWRDDFFTTASSDYNHDLARVSLGFSLAAFRSSDGTQYGARQSQNILRALMDSGFHDIHAEGYAQPAQRSAASAIASKQISVNGQAVTLVAVVVSGGGYGAEWLDNLDIANTEPLLRTHNGFATATDTVYARLYDYLRAHCPTGTSWKLWVTGFGRGGAIANLLGARCAQALLPAAEIYGYSFANPGITTLVADAQAHVGLYSIVCPADLIAALPPQSWGYRRYGRTLALPSSRTGDADAQAVAFDAALSAVQRMALNVVPDGSLLPFLRLTGEGDRRLLGVERFAERLLTFLMPTPALYDAQLYPSLTALWQSGDGEAQSAARVMRTFTSTTLLQLVQPAADLSLVGALDACYRLGALATTRDAALVMLREPDATQRYPTVASVLRGDVSEDAVLTYDEIAACLSPALTDAVDLLVSMHSPILYLGWMTSITADQLTPFQP
jgi:hypothetical protein